MNTQSLQKRRPDFWKLLGIGVLGLFVLRLLTAAATPGYLYDQNTFTAWALRMAQTPASEFYAEGYFADYPPGYLWVLKLVGEAMLALGAQSGTALARVLLALPVILGECGLMAAIAVLGRKAGGDRAGLLFGLCVALNLSLWFDTGVWKQVDALFSLGLVLCFWLLIQKRWLPGALAYGLTLAIKPQALIAGPVLALAFLLPLLQREGRLRQIGRTVLGAVVAVLAVYLPAVPFWGWKESLPNLVEKYTSTSRGYPYAVVNAGNLFAALGANWADENARFLFLSWKQWGTLFLVIFTAATIAVAVLSARRGRFCPMILAGFYTTGVFVLAHSMHERYLVFGMVLVLAAAALHNSRSLLYIAGGLTVTSLLNQMLVYFTVETEAQFLMDGVAGFALQLLSLANVALFVPLVLVTLWKLLELSALSFVAKWDGSAEEKLAAPITSWAKAARRPLPEQTVRTLRQPPVSRKEVIGLCAGTLAAAVLAFTYLGSTSAPESGLLVPQNETLSVAIEAEEGSAELWVYPGIPQNGGIKLLDESGAVAAELSTDYLSCFKWQTLDIPAGGRYTLEISGAQLMEIAFRDANGTLLSASCDQPALLDEQDAVPDTISQLNGMYFDEIYHARTAYEMLHEMPVYETTHPPLGKDLIMLGIAIFGMNAFGWRFAGALCGVLMIPAVYLLVRRLSARRWPAAFAAAIVGLDFMRFGQSRMATIDSFVVLFILWSGFFMVWYCQSVLEKGVDASLLPMALGGVFFGLGAAAKWTGIYAGAGLAVLYFAVLYLRWKQKRPGFAHELRMAIAGGVLFYVMVPLVIYLLSYLPYWWRDPSFSISDWWNCQTAMYRYHSTLQSTHTFQSMWFTWPLDWRPVWYYYSSAGDKYASISGMAGPVLAWCGTVAVVYTIVQAVRRKTTMAQNMALVLYLTQLLPWVAVTRCTFIYHYFASLMFSAVLLALMLQQLAAKHPRGVKRACIGMVAVSAVLLVWFYPALTGLPVSRSYAESTMWLPSWDLYPF